MDVSSEATLMKQQDDLLPAEIYFNRDKDDCEATTHVHLSGAVDGRLLVGMSIRESNHEWRLAIASGDDEWLNLMGGHIEYVNNFFPRPGPRVSPKVYSVSYNRDFRISGSKGANCVRIDGVPYAHANDVRWSDTYCTWEPSDDGLERILAEELLLNDRIQKVARHVLRYHFACRLPRSGFDAIVNLTEIEKNYTPLSLVTG